MVSNARLGSLLTGFTASVDSRHAGSGAVQRLVRRPGRAFCPSARSARCSWSMSRSKPDAPAGLSPLNLRAAVFDNDLQELRLVPAATNGWDEQVDGLFTVLGTEERWMANDLTGSGALQFLRDAGQINEPAGSSRRVRSWL